MGNRQAAGSAGPPDSVYRDETTYDHDLSDPEDIDRAVAIHCDVVARRLRKNHLAAQTVSVKSAFLLSGR